MSTQGMTRSAFDTSVYVPVPARVSRIGQLTEMEKLLELEFLDGHALGHDPGQFVQISVLGIGECPISACSSPTKRGVFELCVRRAGSVTNHIHTLAEGEVVGVRGPLGHGFDMAELHGRDILIVAGGLGLAPVRSLIDYILDERDRFGRFDLLYGTRSPSEILFRQDITRWRESPDVHFQMTVDRPDEQWRGRSGVVTTLFKELPKLDPEATRVVIVGPPVMFKFAVLEVLARRIPMKDIYCSLERRMACGIGKCGHCQVNNVYVCLEGPVFTYAQLRALREAVE